MGDDCILLAIKGTAFYNIAETGMLVALLLFCYRKKNLYGSYLGTAVSRLCRLSTCCPDAIINAPALMLIASSRCLSRKY